MALIHAQAVLMRDSQLAQDNVVNTFSFGTSLPGAATNADLDAVVTAVIDFYKGTTGAARRADVPLELAHDG